MVPFIDAHTFFFKLITGKQIFHFQTVYRIKKHAEIITAYIIYYAALADKIIRYCEYIFVRIFCMELCKNIIQSIIICVNNIFIFRILIHGIIIKTNSVKIFLPDTVGACAHRHVPHLRNPVKSSIDSAGLDIICIYSIKNSFAVGLD